MSTKLNAEQIAENRFPGVDGEPLPIVQRGYYAEAIREVTQPIADERDEYREALEAILKEADDELVLGHTPIAYLRKFDTARAILAKHKRP